MNRGKAIVAFITAVASAARKQENGMMKASRPEPNTRQLFLNTVQASEKTPSIAGVIAIRIGELSAIAL